MHSACTTPYFYLILEGWAVGRLWGPLGVPYLFFDVQLSGRIPLTTGVGPFRVRSLRVDRTGAWRHIGMLPMIRRLEATVPECATVLTGAASPTYALRHRSVSVHSIEPPRQRCCSPPDVCGRRNPSHPPASPLLRLYNCAASYSVFDVGCSTRY
jgi:hypothetical protein